MKQISNYDAAIIGAGASGLAAALTVKKYKPGASVLVLEKKERAAKKLAATGNGRCNLSNEACENKDVVFGFFSENGIMLRKDESGRFYPCSEDAGQLASLLTEETVSAGVRIRLDSEVKKVEACPEGGFLLLVEEKGAERTVYAKKLLIAAGGKSYPSMGTTGDGYVMARRLGHGITPPAPGLTAVCTEMKELRTLKGVRAKAKVCLKFEGKQLFSEEGEIQFRSDSVSGICVMNLSNHMKPHGSMSFDGYVIAADFAPFCDEKELTAYMKAMQTKQGLGVCDALKSLIKYPLAEAVVSRGGILPEQRVADLTEEEIVKTVRSIKNFEIPVTGLKGWKEAQITCGGVAAEEITAGTMESKIVPGLYFSGEVTDYAGPCGGFNLHHAWLTGILAGKAIAAEV